MVIRLAEKTELDRINELRKQVNELHTNGAPDIFIEGFNPELRDYIYTIWDDSEQDIVVADCDGVICGFAVLHHIYRPANPYMHVRNYIDIDEFCVDEDYRRRGVATEMIAFIREYTRKKGLNRIELNMWEFNQDALQFYEAAGFRTYRRYMEMEL